MTPIKEIINELKSEGWTQTSLAKELGVNQSTISKWLNEVQPVLEPIAMLIESKFGYCKEWILDGNLPKKNDQKEILNEVSRIAKQGRDLDKVPEIRDLVPKIMKMKREDYDMLVEVLKKFAK